MSYLYEFATEQEIRTVVHGPSYEKAFTEQDREQIKRKSNKTEEEKQ